MNDAKYIGLDVSAAWDGVTNSVTVQNSRFSRLEVHAAQQVLEARVRPQRIETGERFNTQARPY